MAGPFVMNSHLRRALRTCLSPMARQVAQRHIVGPQPVDALRVCRRLSQHGLSSTTIGYWDQKGESPQEVADVHLAAANVVAQEQLDCYISVKLSAFGVRSRARGGASAPEFG